MRVDELADNTVEPQGVRLRCARMEPTVTDVLDMQRAVRRIYLGKKRTSPSARRGALRRYADEHGNVVAKGVVCDARWHQGGARDGRVSRLCLLFPAILAAPGEWVYFDTHMWLKPQSLSVPDADFAYRLPSGDEMMCHMPDNGIAHARFSVCLGDTLVVVGHVAAYSKAPRDGRDAVESFGFDRWVPAAGGFVLFEDSRATVRSVPRRLMARESFVMGVSVDEPADLLLGVRENLEPMKCLLDGNERF